MRHVVSGYLSLGFHLSRSPRKNATLHVYLRPFRMILSFRLFCQQRASVQLPPRFDVFDSANLNFNDQREVAIVGALIKIVALARENSDLRSRMNVNVGMSNG